MLFTLVTTVLGSSSLSIIGTVILTRKKAKVETAEIMVQSALTLEQRAHDRYKTTCEALEAAEKLLAYAREQLKDQEDYILELQELLTKNGLHYRPYDVGGSYADVE